ncbi:MAG: FtsH protease regulator HflK [Planctomycetes bacterium ADurb.Bin126]|nr:MAG: FtsH protease regulator HflK [Planctomycetes bacterium ADurb.Bin126]HOD83681.1 SPFH domain-containing protein [Phycisphaerae bacterium]HQL75162.1 SPFH domain-containing protein [Phycisphaerae bacterium]
MIAQRRGKNVAVGGLVLQFICTGVLVGAWLATGRPQSVLASLWVTAGGLGIWLMAAILFYCRQLQQQEALEIDEAARAGQESSIFDEKGQGRPAQARLDFVLKWVLPASTLLLAAYHATFGVLVLRWALSASPSKLAGMLPGAFFTGMAGFAMFLFSRYATGMGRSVEWRPLRAAGGYALFCALSMALAVAAMVFAFLKYGGGDRIAAMVIPAVQIVLAVELALNFLVDLYRPRLPGQEHHLSFDSRLLDLLAEPARVGHSIAETLNYQFGFEVSKTWFYQLLSRAFVPLLVLGTVIMFAITGIVIIPEGERGVVLRWGKLNAAYKSDPMKASLGPGVHLKWPWPVETVRRFETGRVQELWMGAGRERTEEERQAALVNGKELQLWTSEHGPREELNFLVAVPGTQAYAASGEKKPVMIIKLVVPVQYVIEDPFKFGFTHSNPRQVLECVAHREMVEYCARATLSEPIPGRDKDRPEAIMTFGRQRTAAGLKQRIQQAADKLDLGVRITNVTLLAVHPPSEAAEAYQKVGEAERKQDVLRYQALTEASDILTRTAGDAQLALRLAFALRRVSDLERLQESASPSGEVDRLINEVRGVTELYRLQIRKEEALGRLGQERRASLLSLIDDAQTHLTVLEKAKAQGKSFDFAAALADARTDIEGDAQTKAGLLNRASGEIGVRIAQARSDRWKTELAEQSRWVAFSRELAAYKASPEVYALDRWLDVWDSVLPDITKYVLAVPQDRVEVRVDATLKAQELSGLKLEDKD